MDTLSSYRIDEIARMRAVLEAERRRIGARTKTELASAIGVSTKTIRFWEQGRWGASNPVVSLLLRHVDPESPDPAP